MGPALYATEELRELFTWIRAYNEVVAPERAIRVFGADVCLHTSCVAGVASYLAEVDPEYVDTARALLAPMKHLMAEFRASLALVVLSNPGGVTLAGAGTPETRAATPSAAPSRAAPPQLISTVRPPGNRVAACLGRAQRILRKSTRSAFSPAESASPGKNDGCSVGWIGGSSSAVVKGRIARL